jgi:hypothetical protein
MDIKIAQRVYVLTEEYVNKDGETAVAKVKLTVDETNGIFEVVPGDGSDSFCYKSRMKGDYNMWAAVSKLAYMAVEFGQKQITKEEVNKNVD